MKTLQSMVQFVKEQKENNTIDLAQRFINSFDHALLLSQQPNIGMFVPAVCENGVWRVFENLSSQEFRTKNNLDYYIDDWKPKHKDYCIQYQQAKSKVIFKGWDINFQTKEIDGLIHHSIGQLWFYKGGQVTINSTLIKTLEDLVNFNLEMV
jgi:hypothetical protein